MYKYICLHIQITNFPQELNMECMCVLVAQSYLTLCDPMDCSPPGSSVYGIFQARILQWVVISYSRGSSWPRDWTCFYFISRQILYHYATWEFFTLLLSKFSKHSQEFQVLQAFTNPGLLSISLPVRRWLSHSYLIVVVFQLLSRASLWPRGLQHTGLPCPSPSPGVCSNSCPLNWWCHPTISPSVVAPPFSEWLWECSMTSPTGFPHS